MLWPSRTLLYRYPETSDEEITLVSNAEGHRVAAREAHARLAPLLGDAR